MTNELKCELLEEMKSEVRLGVYYLGGYSEEIDHMVEKGLIMIVRTKRVGDEDYVRITDKGRALLSRWFS